MAGVMKCCFFNLFLILVATTAMLDGQTLNGPPHNKVVVCYVGTWAAYRPPPGSFDISEIDGSLCTHLVYSFAGLDEHNSAIKSLDPWQDLEKDYGKNGFKRMIALKARYPHLKVSIAIGGWNEGSLKYSMMSEDQEKRKKFVKSVLQFLDMFKFDGLDLDWEYPARRDGRPQDKTNYVALVKELKDAFEPHGYLLTAALGAGRDTMEAAYDLSRLSKYLDFIHMMCYDYHGTWDGKVGANAPISSSFDDDVLTVESTIKYMLSHGVSPYKMVLGLPLYGRTFVLQNAEEKSVLFGTTPVLSQGFMGPFTKEAGFMGYNEICRELTNSSSPWSVLWDEVSATPYLRDGARIITYDDERSLAIKVRMAIQYGLGGLMVWSLDTDDFRGHCGGVGGERGVGGAAHLVDFQRRLDELGADPLLQVALQRLNLPDGTQRERLNRRSAYIVDNGKLSLRVPERISPKYSLMQTINEATVLAMEEKRIFDEMEKVIKENEIDDSGKQKKSSGNTVAVSALVMLGCLLALNVE